MHVYVCNNNQRKGDISLKVGHGRGCQEAWEELVGVPERGWKEEKEKVIQFYFN